MLAPTAGRNTRSTTIEACRTRVRLAINISAIGEAGPGSALENLDDIDPDRCTAAIEDGGELIWGVAVNVDHRDCGDTDAREVIRRALAAADQTGRPLLVGMQRPTDWSFEDQMALLRPGDVVTYMYRREPHCIIENGRVHPALREARERGILFDVGHGFSSFDFEVAEAAIAAGFAPDTISTDSHAMHVGARPAHDHAPDAV